MKLFFGLEYDDIVYPVALDKGEVLEAGQIYLGPKRLLHFLEGQLGIQDAGSENDYLRIEQYRQLLTRHIASHPNPFYEASFESDQMGTALTLLNWRDELKLGGWDFTQKEALPARIKTLLEIENLLKATGDPLHAGFADRFARVLELMQAVKITVDELWLNEPEELLPYHIKKVFDLLAVNAVKQIPGSVPLVSKSSDLTAFQSILNEDEKHVKQTSKADGSLIIFQFKRETEAAAWLAGLFRQNPDLRPLCLIPEKNRVLDNAMVQEGLPSMGIVSESVVRPTLQVLKLVSAFLWNPVDPFKVMEFVSLAMVPLQKELAALIAEEVSRSPGLNSERWQARVAAFFRALEERAETDRSVDIRKIRYEYRLWFQSPRFDISGTVPVDIVIEKFRYLADWGVAAFKEGNKQQRSLLVLSEQSRKIKEILEALPASESSLTSLQVERIVRTVYEPSPVTFKEKEVGHLPFIHFPSALTEQVDHLVWWNFIDPGTDADFNKWYPEEIAFFKKSGVHPVYPELQQQQRLWASIQPVLRTKQQLILVLPDWSEGREVNPHPLLSDLTAAFHDTESLQFKPFTDNEGKFSQWFKLPKQVFLDSKPLGEPQPYLQINDRYSLITNKKESYSSLDSLFYFPYQWVFRHQVKFRKSSILSVVKEPTLMGNLAHRLFEFMFKEDVYSWTKTDTEDWITGRITSLFQEEGAVLLLYGKEPERVNFENKLKYAAWALVRMIQNNGWDKVETEVTLEGMFMDIPLKGIADMVLTRGSEKAIIDLKWRGGRYRENLIRNKEDLQLVLYSKLLAGEEDWAHTSYFILESGKMIARNTMAFKEAVAVAPDEDFKTINQEIWEKMVNTYEWRKAQLEKGRIEIRTEKTVHILEEDYSENQDFTNLLEMKDGDAPFDDFKTLISLLK